MLLESVIWRPLVPIVSQKKGPPRQEWCQRILQSYRSKIVAKVIVQFSSYRIHTFCFAPTYPQNGAVHSYSVAAGKHIIGHHSCMEIILIGGSEHHAKNGLMRELTLWDLIGLGELPADPSKPLKSWWQCWESPTDRDQFNPANLCWGLLLGGFYLVRSSNEKLIDHQSWINFQIVHIEWLVLGLTI